MVRGEDERKGDRSVARVRNTEGEKRVWGQGEETGGEARG